MDIFGALEGSSPPVHFRKCKIQRFLDDIPDETPGKAELVAIVTTTDRTSPDYRTGDQVDKILIRLGLATSTKTLGDHRAHRCRCFA